MELKEYSIVKYLGEDNSNYGLTNGKSYAVETNEDYVDQSVWEKFECVTVWNDKGYLAEIDKGNYEFQEGTKGDWIKAKPKRIFVEMY